MTTVIILGKFRSVSKFRREIPAAGLSNRESCGNYYFMDLFIERHNNMSP